MVDSHKLVPLSRKGDILAIIGHENVSQSHILVLHCDILVEGEVAPIIAVYINIVFCNWETQEHVVVSDGHRLDYVLKLVIKGLLVDEFCLVEDVDVDPPIFLGQNQPLVVIGDGSISVVSSFDLQLLEEWVVIDGVIVAEDVEEGRAADMEDPLSVGCDVEAVGSTLPFEFWLEEELGTVVGVYREGSVIPEYQNFGIGSHVDIGDRQF